MQPTDLATPFAEQEPGFILEQERRLKHCGDVLSPGLVGDWFAHMVARQPGNLRAHVQRIHHHLERSDADGVAGALADLFMVLDHKGADLRQRMLHESQAVLPAELFAWFTQRIDQGLTPCSALPRPCPSVLWSGALGRVDLIAPTAHIPNPGRQV